MSVFVTVGTTKFDDLMKVVDSPDFQQALVRGGYERLLVQTGNSATVPQARTPKLDVQTYKFKPSLQDDFRNADLVVSHAGYGCLMESLTAGKKVVAVINTTLMDNHQLEIAQELERRQHLRKCLPDASLVAAVETMSLTKFEPLPKACPEKYARMIDGMMGFV
jgi:beta-1,4-N-acetylglucosaminyltransferase